MVARTPCLKQKEKQIVAIDIKNKSFNEIPSSFVNKRCDALVPGKLYWGTHYKNYCGILPENYYLYLGKKQNLITYYYFFHLNEKNVIDLANTNFTQSIQEI